VDHDDFHARGSRSLGRLDAPRSIDDSRAPGRAAADQYLIILAAQFQEAIQRPVGDVVRLLGGLLADHAVKEIRSPKRSRSGGNIIGVAHRRVWTSCELAADFEHRFRLGDAGAGAGSLGGPPGGSSGRVSRK